MKNSLPAANRSTVRPHLNSPCRKTGTAARAGRALPLRDRALVLLTADGWTAEEIGLAIGTSPTAVRQTVCRVRLRLRQWRRDEREAHARRA